MVHARIVGTGSHVPEQVVTNQDLVSRFGIDTDDAWIRTRTGVRERRFAEEGVGTAALALPAAQAALDDAGVAAHELDQIVFCTLSPDRAFPGSGVYLQELLGLPGEHGAFPACVDLRAQCSGFLYGLSHATAALRAGMARRVLLVGAEVHSAALDLTTRGRTVASLFGDGAGAVVLEATDQPGARVRAVQLGADGRYADELRQDVWDMSRRPFVPLDDDGFGRIGPEGLWAQMNGPLVFKHAVERMTRALTDVLTREGLDVPSVDLFLFHQANMRINRQVQQLLDIPDERTLNNIERYGNTTAATLPLLLDEAVRTGRLEPGMTVAMAAFGSGFTWGAAVLDW